MVSCSNDEPVDDASADAAVEEEAKEGGNSEDELPFVDIADYLNGTLDAGALGSFRLGEESAIYEFESRRTFISDELSDGKWVDATDMVRDYTSPIPASMVFTDGYCFIPFELLEPHPLYMPWRAYIEVTGKYVELMLYAEFGMSEDNRLLDIAGNEYSIESLSDDAMTISRRLSYVGGRTPGKEGVSLYVQTFRKEHFSQAFYDETLRFKSEHELYEHVISLLRAEFGDVIDLNEVFYPSAIFDDPIVNIADLAAELGVQI